MNIWRTAEKNRADRLKKSAEIRCQKKKKEHPQSPSWTFGCPLHPPETRSVFTVGSYRKSRLLFFRLNVLRTEHLHCFVFIEGIQFLFSQCSVSFFDDINLHFFLAPIFVNIVHRFKI